MEINPAAIQSRFLRACHRLPVDRTPVWFMRQAGRYLPEYRAVRARYSLLEICAQPELAAEVTLQPLRLLPVDAAIIFADILLPLIPMGVRLDYSAGEGPVIHTPVNSYADAAALKPIEPREALSNVLEAIRLVRHELNGKVPLIGFAGGPFTLACYLIEGGSSRGYLKTKQMMYAEPHAWRLLMGKLTRVVTDYLLAQADSGAQVVQLFDSWVGTLGPQDYREYVLPYSQIIFRALKGAHIPAIHFGTDTSALLPMMREAGGDVIGLDWRVSLDQAWNMLGPDVGVQGNLDPAALFAPKPEIGRRVVSILEQAGGRPGHIFNLGHGVLPDTPIENVLTVIELVHEFSKGARS
ncbi:MAG: uroporphyrinogen decarboxylase [Chloroflexi bacterium]|nr:uroporphyrinogen decarboxylase [Chloroflexota bacterium]